MRTVLLGAAITLLVAVSAQARPALSFKTAMRASERAVPRAYVVQSCTQMNARQIVCELFRDSRGWRLRRQVDVRLRAGRLRSTPGPAEKYCRLVPAKRWRCNFGLPRRS
jgi:hypothetical protein